MTNIRKRPGLVLPSTTLAPLRRAVDYKDSIIYVGGEGQDFAISGGRLSALRDISKGRKRKPFLAQGTAFGMKLRLLSNGITVLDGTDSGAGSDGYRVPVALLNGYSAITHFVIYNRPNAALVDNQDLLSINVGHGSSPNLAFQFRTNALGFASNLVNPVTGASGGLQSSPMGASVSNSWEIAQFIMNFETGERYMRRIAADGASNEATPAVSAQAFPLSYFDPSNYHARLFGRPGTGVNRVQALIHRSITISGAHRHDDGGLGQLFVTHCINERARIAS
ncbi:hypothetical protein QBK99_12665 [Corticibacterium sp. UT-5YL-CI-8]|nr:hypothetical protein [Tianweitania sp. UT-5YL-CI-8]